MIRVECEKEVLRAELQKDCISFRRGEGLGGGCNSVSMLNVIFRLLGVGSVVCKYMLRKVNLNIFLVLQKDILGE